MITSICPFDLIKPMLGRVTLAKHLFRENLEEIFREKRVRAREFSCHTTFLDGRSIREVVKMVRGSERSVKRRLKLGTL